MTTLTDVSWTEAPLTRWDEVCELVDRCLETDGGLPLAADLEFMYSRWGSPALVTRQARTAEGELVAAGLLRPGDSGPTYAGMVDPGVRGRGLGSQLLDWGLISGARVVESELLTAEATALFTSRGLQRTFAEDVMCIDFRVQVPQCRVAPPFQLWEWTPGLASRFFEMYEIAFRDRPDFPELSPLDWIEDVAHDADFRPTWSLLAFHPDLGDVGFLTAKEGWIDQVGVMPAFRRLGLGEVLLSESLRRMADDNRREAWLNVNVNNPGAAMLYRRLGFDVRGQRGRFTPMGG
ncbi:GNAT family N-acetyltransferase [Actinoplanes sp. N902-109]|uniref:GNAT family N-acetyltransferase n=1 Tax=Actinoplanes sp. (strain N902-109) TaxID=649831 RepID=UPI0003296369|nr:GNAT family N-acetyltransferase [Actinoplanes sp. N902-109]AGL15637.1 hypothetical protein L083_2127 [Actinoplanes sp. N902-109]